MRMLFVHGTGVRRERHDVAFARIRDGLTARLPGVRVESCYWGDEYGTSLSCEGRSIPTKPRTRGGYDDGLPGSPDDIETARWLLLTVDPLCELRALAELDQADDDLGMPGVQADGARVAHALDDLLADGLEPDDELSTLLLDAALLDCYDDALREVVQAEEFAKACSRAADSAAAVEVAAAAARAVVAGMLAAAGDEALCLADERDRAVDLLAQRLGGTARFPGERAASVLGKLALRVSTQPVLNHWRGSLTGKSTPALGDILRYQARGEPLRALLRERIGSEAGPTVVVGHSLGGIALVDLLAQSAAAGEPLAEVPLLVTVGSQAPLLYELGALTGLEPAADLPARFPPWLNIFDRQDLLAFVAGPVFPDRADITDFEVASHQPFPVSHSAYWKSRAVYDRIAQAVRALG